MARRAPLSALLSCVCACCVCSLANGAAALCPVCVLPILRHRLRRSMPLRLASRASLASLGRVSGVSSSRIAIRHRHILSRSLDHARFGVAVPSGAPPSYAQSLQLVLIQPPCFVVPRAAVLTSRYARAQSCWASRALQVNCKRYSSSSPMMEPIALANASAAAMSRPAIMCP